APNFESVAKAYGIQSRTIENLNIFDQISDEIFSNNQPEVVNILLNNKLTNVEPKLIVGKPIEDMYPFIEKSKLKELMFLKNKD
ncbi:hypothetical protein K6638_001037, partial [Campylobacter coli]|nr:hypothetical protein [Campylobacter coli]EKO5292373.1 hypothetical protein [Campylobacter coli]